MPAPPILVANGEHELPLLEEDSVGLAQRFTGVIGTRSLGGRSIQLENRKSLTYAQNGSLNAPISGWTRAKNGQLSSKVVAQ